MVVPSAEIDLVISDNKPIMYIHNFRLNKQDGNNVAGMDCR